MRIHLLQHVPFEGPAAIADWAADRGHTLNLSRLYDGATPPAQTDFDLLVVMGGPMGIYDESDHPWLAIEKEFLREAIAAGKTIVGICLGAQLLADLLGARVYPGPQKEIGWFPIELTPAGSEVFGVLHRRLQVYHWHGDTFDLPPDSVHLALSEGCPNQAFLYQGRVLGLQFHIESTPESVAAIVANCADEIVPARYIQTAESMLAATEEDYARINQALFGILDRLPARGKVDQGSGRP